MGTKTPGVKSTPTPPVIKASGATVAKPSGWVAIRNAQVKSGGPKEAK